MSTLSVRLPDSVHRNARLYAEREGTSQVKRSKGFRRVQVSADGAGVVSHAGVGLLREMAEYTGLVEGVSAALIDTAPNR